MMRRMVVCITVAILLSFFGSCLAQDLPGRGDPGPRPWQWGDPDWPAQNKHFVYNCEIGYGGALCRNSADPSQSRDALVGSELRYRSSASNQIGFEILGFKVSLRR